MNRRAWRTAAVGILSAWLSQSSSSAAIPVAELPGVTDAARPAGLPASASKETAVLKFLRLLNQIPEAQLNERADPAFSLLRGLYDEDGPDFPVLRQVLGRASVRGGLNPGTKVIAAAIVSQRWDTFQLSGNLFLAGLRSRNPELRLRARRKLIHFIQPAHIPVLIQLLATPGPNILAYELLQEATGKNLDPNVKIWQSWWQKAGARFDVSGHLLEEARARLGNLNIPGFDAERFWSLPARLRRANRPYAERPSREQAVIAGWHDWVRQDVRHFVDGWAVARPILEKIVHQPDPRINQFLEALVKDPGFGDYASVVLAWRASAGSLPVIQEAFQGHPTASRALARGSLGDPQALEDLLRMMARRPAPLSYRIMEDPARDYSQVLHQLGVVPAEEAFELLVHRSFELATAVTHGEKKKALQRARRWLQANRASLVFDPRRGFFTLPAGQ